MVVGLLLLVGIDEPGEEWMLGVEDDAVAVAVAVGLDDVGATTTASSWLIDR